MSLTKFDTYFSYKDGFEETIVQTDSRYHPTVRISGLGHCPVIIRPRYAKLVETGFASSVTRFMFLPGALPQERLYTCVLGVELTHSDARTAGKIAASPGQSLVVLFDGVDIVISSEEDGVIEERKRQHIPQILTIEQALRPDDASDLQTRPAAALIAMPKSVEVRKSLSRELIEAIPYVGALVRTSRSP